MGELLDVCLAFVVFLLPAKSLGGYRSGQTGQTVNLLAMPSQVRILHPPLDPSWIERISGLELVRSGPAVGSGDSFTFFIGRRRVLVMIGENLPEFGFFAQLSLGFSAKLLH
jgi:hypothetical protein